MELKEFLEKLKTSEGAEELKALVEVQLEKLIAEHYESLKTEASKKLAEAIPGEKFDTVATKALEVALETIKVKLLEQIEKISAKV